MKRIVFAIVIFLLMYGFYFYSSVTIEKNTYYESMDITEVQSDEFKTLMGLSQFKDLRIKKFIYRVVYGDDSVGTYTFDIAVSDSEYRELVDFVKDHMSQPLAVEQPCMKIKENEASMQMDYMCYNDSAGEFLAFISGLEHNVKYSEEVWLLVPKFVLLILVYGILLFRKGEKKTATLVEK